ncbi:MAG TPA: metallophosphoesterase family protein [Alphaproteobacteria bacterium]
MTLVDSLGVLAGPVLIFGGPYGNLEATEALRRVARERDIPPSQTICTGDVVAYGADPQAAVDLIRDWGCAVVMGNCEEALAADAADCGCGFEDGTACAALSDQWFTATRRDLNDDAKRWMGGLPRRLEFTLGGRRLAAVHGSTTQINRFIFASTPAAVKAAEIAASGCDGIVAGHCGLPFTDIVDGRLWHNSGALGLPANDGTPLVWFSVLAAGEGGLRIEHHALAFDHATAAAKMRARAYPAGYADCLASGLWPSCDVLPAAERAARGQALVPATHLWPASLPQAAE